MRRLIISVLLGGVAFGAHAQATDDTKTPSTTPPASSEPATPSTAPKTTQATKPSGNVTKNTDVRISGTVEKFDGQFVSISPSKGITLVLRFEQGPGVNSMRKAKASDIKANQQVSALTNSNPTGGSTASRVIIYEDGAEQRAGGATTDSAQVVAKVTDVSSSSDGPVLSLTYPDGVRKVTVGKEAVVWIAKPAGQDDIKPGYVITVAGTKEGDGEVKVIKAAVTKSSDENPPL